MELQSPYGHTLLITMGGGLNSYPLAQLKLVDFVSFWSIQPIAIGIRLAR